MLDAIDISVEALMECVQRSDECFWALTVWESELPDVDEFSKNAREAMSSWGYEGVAGVSGIPGSGLRTLWMQWGDDED